MWWCNWLALWRAGARPLRLTADMSHDLPRIDGLLVGGGDDIGAELYRGELKLGVRPDRERDQLELDLFCQAVETDMPVLGICRGSQMINIGLGGTLHQDIYQIYKDAPDMRTILPRKRVKITRDSHLHDIIGIEECMVNSLHHQSVDELGRGLAVVAKDERGIVQATERKGGAFLVGVQWHPEFLVFDRAQQRLFRSLVDAARDYSCQSSSSSSGMGVVSGMA